MLEVGDSSWEGTEALLIPESGTKMTETDKSAESKLVCKEYKQQEEEEKKDKEEEGAEITFQYFLDLVGTNGPWNYMVFFLCAMCSFVSPLQSLSYQVLGDTPDHWCHIPELKEANWTDQQIIDFAIPFNNGTKHHETCFMHNYNYTAAVQLGYEMSMSDLDLVSIDDKIMSCRSRDFNLTNFESTTVTEWDLVCERRYLYSTTFSASFVVRLFTSPLIGYVLDTFGRRLCIVVTTSLFLPCCFMAAFAPSYVSYIILRIMIAQFDGCFYTGSFVLCLELSGKSQRSMVGILFCVPWALGCMALPGIAYLVRDWRLLQVWLTVPCLYFLLYYWLLPESPRWLVQQRRYQEAFEVLQKAAKMNNRLPLDEKDIINKMQEMQAQEKSENDVAGCCKGLVVHCKGFVTCLWALVRTWPIFRLTAIVMYTWFASSVTYYGMSLNSVNLSTNMFIYMFLGGLLELPSYFVLWPVVSIFGRKKTFISLFLSCGICIFIIPVLEKVAPSAPAFLKVTLSLGGKMAINMAYQLVFLYTGELYQTSQRSFVINVGSIFSSLGGAVAPYINDILVVKASWAPSATFVIFSILGAWLTIFLPETKDEELPDTFHDVEGNVTGTARAKRQRASSILGIEYDYCETEWAKKGE